MDKGIWAVWYDLAVDDREEFLAWLHDIHLPEIIKRPGHLWGGHYEIIGSARDNDLFNPEDPEDMDIGNGKDYLMLIGADSTYRFYDPSFSQIEEKHDKQTRHMLALRSEVRNGVFLEEIKIEGVAINQRPNNTAPGPAIQMGSLNMNSNAGDFEIGSWYAQDRLPAMAKMEDCICTRKFVSSAGWAKHSVLYEFTSHAARKANFTGHEKEQSDEESWSTRVINNTIHAPGSPTIANRIWPI